MVSRNINRYPEKQQVKTSAVQTNFTLDQLADPQMRESERILHSCVHCGFCTATCPTYLLLGDELDSPRGRIYLIKDMLEQGKAPTAEVVTHIDRCLSCLSCMTTCPSGVHYMHLVDHARSYIEETYERPLVERLLRSLIAQVLPYPRRFRAALTAARMARPLKRVVGGLPRIGAGLAAMLDLAPDHLPPRDKTLPPQIPTPPVARVALLEGCAQSVLKPSINEAATRLLARCGIEVVPIPHAGCCGALVHHMGRETAALALARTNIDAWTEAVENRGIEAIIVTASGCGTTLKDYGFMLRGDPFYAEKAARIAALTKDISEYLSGLDCLPPTRSTGQTIAYHCPCSMQHGQQIGEQPKNLLKRAGFNVKEAPEGHICCGSAGVYNILQPDIAVRLRARKVAHLEKTRPAAIATGNVGCITQIAKGTQIPVVHSVELLDWASGGKLPEELRNSGF
jgi:glycolate oxidase iron-sulfur subunit